MESCRSQTWLTVKMGISATGFKIGMILEKMKSLSRSFGSERNDGHVE
jgi:hypothetical protein